MSKRIKRLERIIPHSDNPQHVDNLRSIVQLQHQGFEGPDDSLEESIMCYGLCWKEDVVCDDELGVLFVYHWRDDPDTGTSRYHRAFYPYTTLSRNEWGWAFQKDRWQLVTAEGMSGFTDMEWNWLPLKWKVWHLVSIYGPHEIFGDDYWEGFTIKGLHGYPINAHDLY